MGRAKEGVIRAPDPPALQESSGSIAAGAMITPWENRRVSGDSIHLAGIGEGRRDSRNPVLVRVSCRRMIFTRFGGSGLTEITISVPSVRVKGKAVKSCPKSARGCGFATALPVDGRRATFEGGGISGLREVRDRDFPWTTPRLRPQSGPRSPGRGRSSEPQ